MDRRTVMYREIAVVVVRTGWELVGSSTLVDEEESCCFRMVLEVDVEGRCSDL